MPDKAEKRAKGVDFRRAINSIEDSFLVLDSTGKIVAFNDAAASRNWAGRPGMGIGAFLQHLVPENYKAIIGRLIEHAIQSGQSQVMEYEDTSKNLRNHYEIRVTATREQDEAEPLIFAVIRDTTTSKVLARRMQAAASEMALILESANAVVFGVDTLGYITEWNNRIAQLTGIAKEEVLTHRVNDLDLTQHEKERFQEIANTVAADGALAPFELKLAARSGNDLTFLLSATPRKTMKGQIVGILYVGEDISELTEYRDSLENKVQERTSELMDSLSKEKELVNIKSRFVSMASHEFRTPLSRISTSADFLGKHTPGGSEREFQARVSSIKKSVSHMTMLLDDILVIGRTEAGKMQVTFASIDFRVFLADIISEVNISTNNSHEVRVTGATGKVALKSDEKLLRNIFINLIGNAIKYSPGKRSVEVTISTRSNRIAIKIRDEGVGIQPAELERIFEPFQRGTNAEAFRGTGLGLSIVKKAVELLEGRIEVKSSLGKGSEFTVSFPARN